MSTKPGPLSILVTPSRLVLTTAGSRRFRMSPEERQSAFSSFVIPGYLTSVESALVANSLQYRGCAKHGEKSLLLADQSVLL